MRDSRITSLLQRLGIKETNPGATTGAVNGWLNTSGTPLVSCSPIDGKPIARVIQASRQDYEAVADRAVSAFHRFKMMPAPMRGEIIQEIGRVLARHKEDLGLLITLEAGKIISEGQGEVQEMVDIAGFATGLSRQLYGRTMHSERPAHRMYEQWHPLGLVGIITAFNFPAAVWSWNALVSGACGNAHLFKPSSSTPLTAIAIQNIIAPVVDRYDIDGIFNLVIGDRNEIGNPMLSDPRIPLISATGSTSMGRHVARTVASRLGRSLLELGGNNAIIIEPDADLDMASDAALFGAVGTAGQRCTSTRRIIVHKGIKPQFCDLLIRKYQQITIGNPMEEKTLMGPLIDQGAGTAMADAIREALGQGGTLLYGGDRLTLKGLEGGCYVKPAIIEARNHYPIVQQETFAPILYLIEYSDIDQALVLHNDVPQGLSSAIFTGSMHAQETFLSHKGSDCGIANVNIGTSGAEIGGAFGGEKETGGGREAGSDAWKIYMRRQTCTINWGRDLPLAQGVRFKPSADLP